MWCCSLHVCLLLTLLALSLSIVVVIVVVIVSDTGGLVCLPFSPCAVR